MYLFIYLCFIVGGCRENTRYILEEGAVIKGHLETVTYEIESRDRGASHFFPVGLDAFSESLN